MRIRLAKKIYTRDAGSIRYITTDISKNRKKTKKYWSTHGYIWCCGNIMVQRQKRRKS